VELIGFRQTIGLLALAASAFVSCSCSGDAVEQAAAHLTGGNPARGRAKVQQYGCASCHVIPGVAGANGLVGPPLTGIANRVYIAGVLPNTPVNMIRWIESPPKVDEKTAMPDLHVTAQDARDIVGYLYTLQ
jgi:cytochrome c2